MTAAFCGTCFIVLTDAKTQPIPRNDPKLCCSLCRRQRRDMRNPRHFFTVLYDGQVAAAVMRGVRVPTYTLDELFVWLVEHPRYAEIWHAYVVSAYAVGFKPSLLRIDRAKPYGLDNLRLTVSAAAGSRPKQAVTSYRAYGFPRRLNARSKVPTS